MDNPIAYTFLKNVTSFNILLWYSSISIKPNYKSISTQFLAENIAAVQAGGVATHFYAPGPESAFGNFYR